MPCQRDALVGGDRDHDADAKLISEAPLLVLPSLATAVGLNEAIVLQQLHWRSRIGQDGWWRANGLELRDEFPWWSEPTIRRTIASLRGAGLVEVQQAGTDRTNQYRIEYEALRKRVGQIDLVHQISSSSNRSDARRQIGVVSIDKKRKGKREDTHPRKFSRFEGVEKR